MNYRYPASQHAGYFGNMVSNKLFDGKNICCQRKYLTAYSACVIIMRHEFCGGGSIIIAAV